MTEKDIVNTAIQVLARNDQCSAEYNTACYALKKAISSTHREALLQLYKNGPVWDGDVISKSHRDDLMRWGLAERAIVKGEYGFTVCNYRGGAVHKAAGD